MVCASIFTDVSPNAMDASQRNLISLGFVRWNCTHWNLVLRHDQGVGQVWHESIKGGALNVPMILGALFGASSVLLGAYGAHGLSDAFIEFPKMKTAFHNAVDYQMLHSLLLIVLGLTYYIPNFRLPRYIWIVLSLSILFFSFSIYLWVFGGPKWLIKLTPLGGVGFVVSWLSLTIWLG